MDDLGEQVAAHDATLAHMHERLGDIRAWLMALTAMQAAVVGALVAILIRP